jgi:hypothetical protein
MQKRRSLRRKLKGLADQKLTSDEYRELTEYTHQELVGMFTLAIYRMASAGEFSPAETRYYLTNINKWLREIVEI